MHLRRSRTLSTRGGGRERVGEGPWDHSSAQGSGCALGDIDLHFGDIDLHFAWQAWHLRHWAGSGDALGSRLPPLSPRPLDPSTRHSTPDPFYFSSSVAARFLPVIFEHSPLHTHTHLLRMVIANW